MKLMCSANQINRYTNFDKQSLFLKDSLRFPSNIPKLIKNGSIYTIDLYCLRPYIEKGEPGTLRNRFFECKECTRYKLHRDCVELLDSDEIKVIEYPNLFIRSRFNNMSIISDQFTTRVLINHCIPLKSISRPINAFVCGNKGYIYFKIKNKKGSILKILKSLQKYNFSFNSVPVVSEHVFLIPNFSSMTTKGGIRIRNDIFSDFVLPDWIQKTSDEYFVLNLKTARHHSKFKYLRDAGKLDPNLNLKLNYMLMTGTYGSYDDFLISISGQKLQYKI